MIGERAERLKRIFVVKHTCSNDERNTPAGLPIGIQPEYSRERARQKLPNCANFASSLSPPGLPIGNGAPVVARRGVAGADGRRLRLRASGLRAPAYVYSNFYSNVWLIFGKL